MTRAHRSAIGPLAVSLVLAALGGCRGEEAAKRTSTSPLTAAGRPASETAAPTPETLPAGPVPVTLPRIDPAALRTIQTTDGFLIVDPAGRRRFGRAAVGEAPYAGYELVRGDSAYGHIFMDPSREHWFRAEGDMHGDYDAYAVLSGTSSADVLVIADATTPARITVRDAIQDFGYRKIALAANAANTAVRYQFGGDPWKNVDEGAVLTLRVDRIADLGTAHPASVLLELTDTTTTSQLLAALATLATAGVERVRLHRMMGWAAIPIEEAISVRGPMADDDVITDEPATIEVGEVKVTGGIRGYGVGAAVTGYGPRFRYCYEKRGVRALKGRIQLDFDVGGDGSISAATASGLDEKIAGCVAASIFDLDITPLAVEGPGHASVAIAFNVPEVTEPRPVREVPTTGWWCWTADDIGLCARLEEQCNASRSGAVQARDAMKDTMRITECAAQTTAWTTDGRHYLPTKAICRAKCRPVR